MRTATSESGAVLILAALLVPALVAVGALALGMTALWTGRHDLQRSADLGALASAAATPTVSDELGLGGLTRLHRLDDVLDADDWRQRACQVAGRQLIDGRSPVATAYRDTGDAPSCDVRWTWESPLLATLGACAADVDDLAGCRDALDDELRASLPAISSLDASVLSAAEQVRQALDPADRLVSSALATQLADACAAESSITLLGVTTWLCNRRVSEVLDAVDHRTGALVGTLDALLNQLAAPLATAVTNGLTNAVDRGVGFAGNRVPQVGVDLAGLAPALTTPRVSVDLGGLDMRPPFSPFTFDVTSSSTARRVIKSALVLPSIGIPGTAAWSSLPASTRTVLQNRLGSDVAGLLARADGGWVVDPNVHTQDAREAAADVLDLFDRMQTSLSTEVSDSLCASLPATVACPVGDRLVDRQHLLGPFMEDIWDATQPPPSGTAPTVQEVLGWHADNDEPLWIVSGLRQVRLGELFGEGVWSSIKAGHVSPNLSGLVSELMFIPALDVVPAAVVRDGAAFRIERVAATTGLYKARLVK